MVAWNMRRKRCFVPFYVDTSEQNQATETGALRVDVVNEREEPIAGAEISLYGTGEPEKILTGLSTDISGQTDIILLDAPPLAWSLEKQNDRQPYSEYNIHVTAPGYEPMDISGIEVFQGEESLERVVLRRADPNEFPGNIVIPGHTLYESYPSKIPEEEIKPVTESGEIILSRVVIPEIVVVHDGAPSDSSAKDYYVTWKDYIKNVVSSEIYATWPEETIRANTLAIQSFALNRVYTEWYRSKGYDFTITSSTAYDQKWVYGRNIYENISQIVDEIFNQYLSRPDVVQPIMTQYCDGKQVQCLDRGWMTQWGSESLGAQGYTALEILRNYYGNSLYINEAELISGIPASWPGYTLTVGASGSKVRQMQEQLDRIAQVYSAIPRISADGIYGSATAEAVRVFQKIFDLPQTGSVDFKTWYKISQIYTGVTRIAELG